MQSHTLPFQSKWQTFLPITIMTMELSTYIYSILPAFIKRFKIIPLLWLKSFFWIKLIVTFHITACCCWQSLNVCIACLLCILNWLLFCIPLPIDKYIGCLLFLPKYTSWPIGWGILERCCKVSSSK